MKKYYFKEKFFKLTDKYPILDENGNEVYFFDQDFKFVGYKAKLKDMEGNVLFDISKKILHMDDYLNLKKIINDKLQIGIYNKYNLYNNSENINRHFLFESKILKMPIEKFDEKNKNQSVERISIMGDREVVDEFEKTYNENLLKTYQTVRNVPEVFEVLNKEADKGQALKRLCKILNIDTNSTLAIGDSNNDKSMLEIAGISATCSNGRESVKEMVDIVSDYSNDQDGVFDILEKVFFDID